MAEHRGQPREALRWSALATEATFRASPSPANRFAAALDTGYSAGVIKGDAAEARAAISRGLARVPVDSIPSSERAWDRIAEIAAAIEDPAMARQALAGYERDLARSARDPAGRRAIYAADVALAERNGTTRSGCMHEADARRSIYDRFAWAQIGRAHDLAGRPDSAMVYYEKFLASADAQDYTDARWRAPVERWLGEVYATKGDNRKAIEHLDRSSSSGTRPSRSCSRRCGRSGAGWSSCGCGRGSS